MSYIIRLGKPSDFNDLIVFYTKEHSDKLPAPSPRAIGQAIEKYQLLIVRRNAGEIAATAGIFDVTPPNAQNFVGELAGTRVTKSIGGTEPIKMHAVLLVLRVIGYAAANFEVLDPKSQESLIAIVKKTNTPSISNILNCGFSLMDERPDWLQYDEISWNGRTTFGEWDYFYAHAKTVQRCAELFFSNGMNQDSFILTSSSRSVKVELQLPGLAYHLRELRLLADGARHFHLMPPPNELLLVR